MPEVTVGGVRFHVQTLGSGSPVVVYLHGLIIDNLSSFYYTLAGPLVEVGARVVLYDLRGHGRSDRPRTGYSTADAVADLFGVLGELGIREPVYLVGHSFGGVATLNAALTHPERVAGLVLVEAAGPAEKAEVLTEETMNTLAYGALALEYEKIPDRLRVRGMRRHARSAATADALINGTSLLEDVATTRPIGPVQLATICCPTLAVYGEHSDLLDAGRLLESHVPDCTLHVVPGLAHTVLRDATQHLLSVLLPWLARHAGTREPITP